MRGRFVEQLGLPCLELQACRRHREAGNQAYPYPPSVRDFGFGQLNTASRPHLVHVVVYAVGALHSSSRFFWSLLVDPQPGRDTESQQPWKEEHCDGGSCFRLVRTRKYIRYLLHCVHEGACRQRVSRPSGKMPPQVTMNPGRPQQESLRERALVILAIVRSGHSTIHFTTVYH